MPGCSAKRCGRNSSKKDQFHENGIDKVSFHQFPANKERKEDWIKRVREAGKGDQWKPSHNAKLCSLHFEERFIDRTCTERNKLMTVLHEEAVPTIFPNVKSKKERKMNTKKEVTIAEEPAEYSRRSARIASKGKIDYEQLVKGLELDDDEGLTVGLQQMFEEEPRKEISSLGEKKMVTLPSNEGYHVILPSISEHVHEIISSEPLPPLSPQSEELCSLIGAPSAKIVTLGAQPFNDDEQDFEPEPVLEDLCCGYDGPSCSSAQESCVDVYGKPFTPFSPSDVCDSIVAEEKVEGTPANKLRQAIEMLQSFQVDMVKELPAEQLTSFDSLLKRINSEGADLLRNLAIIQDQISALKRCSKVVPESEEEKKLCQDIPEIDLDNIDGLLPLDELQEEISFELFQSVISVYSGL